jgi:GntR family transcriptional repressor for pyruvate dehydrogenase complex
MTSPSAVKDELEPVRKSRIYEEVAAQIQRLIVDGRLRPGDHLPPERELAERFGVSRTSVRDAIRVLELMGLLDPRQGEGTVVRDLSPDSLVGPLASLLARNRPLLADLLDVRKMIEPPLAARAAVRASAADRAALEQIFAHQEDKVRRGQVAIEEDSEFHYTIATAANNRVVLRVLDVLMDLLRESRERSLQVAGRLQRSLEGHRRILHAIRRRDATAAEAAMRQHLEEIEEILLRPQEQRVGG